MSGHAGLLVNGYVGRVNPPKSGCAIGLAAVDVVYVAKRRISPVYLVDAGSAGGVG
jgi:hypothetical protein